MTLVTWLSVFWAAPADGGGGLSDPVVQAIICGAATLAVALITVAGAQLAKRSTRVVDQATASKLQAETRKTAAEAAQTELETMRKLIDEVREWSELRLQKQQLEHEHNLKMETAKVRQESVVELAEIRAKHETEMAGINTRMRELEDRYNQAIVAMLAHAPWDADALLQLRQTDPRWPSPPRLEGHRFDDSP